MLHLTSFSSKVWQFKKNLKKPLNLCLNNDKFAVWEFFLSIFGLFINSFLKKFKYVSFFSS